MALTDIKVRTTKPSDKPFKLTDGQGMCKYPGKTAHSLLEIFRHTDYVP